MSPWRLASPGRLLGRNFFRLPVWSSTRAVITTPYPISKNRVDVAIESSYVGGHPPSISQEAPSMIPALPFRLVVIAVAAVIAVAMPRIAAAGRCTTGLVSGGFYCGSCPDPTLLPSPCDQPGEEEVIYDLDKPFG